MKKIIRTALGVSVLVIGVASLNVHALPIPKKCYGLQECQTNPSACTKDKNGKYYKWKPAGKCRRMKRHGD